MGPLLVPIYVRLLGIEAYGLIGILTTLQTMLALFDLGLSTTLNREMARLSARQGKAEEARDLVRTAELLYWSIAGMIAVIMTLLTPSIASHWIRAQTLPLATTRQAFLIMGIILAVQFPFALYSGGLMGLQRQVLLNGIAVGIATARGLGSVLLLWLIGPTIQVFFIWQLIATLLQTGLSAFFLWHSLPGAPNRPQFRQSLIRATWRFTAGMMGISFFTLSLVQSDKIILSRLLTLEQFGYYALATVIASSLYLVISPIFVAVFPQLSQLIARDDEEGLKSLYHRSCQLLSVTMLPITVIVALFAPEILLLWTRNPVIVHHTHLLVTLLVTGTALNGLMNVPYALQVASGWLRLTLYQSAISTAVLLPLLFWVANRYGAVGAACIWITVEGGYVLIGIQVMHTRLLRGEMRAWYLRDVGLPLLGALSIALAGRLLFPVHVSGSVLAVALALVSLATLGGAGVLTPLTREWVQKRLMSH